MTTKISYIKHQYVNQGLTCIKDLGDLPSIALNGIISLCYHVNIELNIPLCYCVKAYICIRLDIVGQTLTVK
jgi:hypothetical protein